MKTIVVMGLDLTKSVFQIRASDADGKIVVRRQLRRGEVLKFFSVLSPCLVGMEECASAHHWARELVARGHEVRLMSPAYVKPHFRRPAPITKSQMHQMKAPVSADCGCSKKKRSISLVASGPRGSV